VAETERQVRHVRFGNFEVDLRAGELRKSGVKLKFGGQPFQVLTVLLEHAGDVVTREELQKRLWPDTFVDFRARYQFLDQPNSRGAGGRRGAAPLH
jgi:DNA-binding winged helix-turn-helix (wHTH) protein